MGIVRSRLARQVAVLGLVFCAVALTLAVPLRNYLAQRAELGTTLATEHQRRATLVSLQQQEAALTDPDYIRSEAKRRLQYVKPGSTVYVVHAPALPAPARVGPSPAAPTVPWYSALWNTLADPPAGNR